MNKNIVWAWAIKNSVCVICWTVLAIIFNKWWIALFGLLFMSELQTKDKCGKHSPYADNYNESDTEFEFHVANKEEHNKLIEEALNKAKDIK